MYDIITTALSRFRPWLFFFLDFLYNKKIYIAKKKKKKGKTADKCILLGLLHPTRCLPAPRPAPAPRWHWIPGLAPDPRVSARFQGWPRSIPTGVEMEEARWGLGGARTAPLFLRGLHPTCQSRDGPSASPSAHPGSHARSLRHGSPLHPTLLSPSHLFPRELLA